MSTVCLLLAAGGCNRDSDRAATAYEGTVGDAMLEFVDTIDALADILAGVNDLDDCKNVREPLAFQIDRLRQTRSVIGDLSEGAWAQMPRSLDEKRQAAIRRFNAEAVRVLIEREQGLELRDVIADVPALIYPEARG